MSITMRSATAGILALVLVGCVPKKKYDELQADLTSMRTELEGRLAERETTIAQLQTKVSSLEAEKTRLEETLKGKEARLAELQEKNASMLKDKGALAGEIENMKAALAELEARKAAADARLRDFRDLLDRFKSLIDAGTLEVKIQDGRMIVSMATDVLFASGSATLSAEGKEALTEVTQILVSIPKREYQVEGHTDDDPISTAQFPSNWYLASGRALNVVNHMLDNGMPPERISGASFGEHRPVASNEGPDGKAQNRRIEIVVVPDLSQLPGFDELQAINK
jgi:chemotaxis protein MotB